MSSLTITHFSDPGCPYGYSAGPALAALHWRYGDQLSWRHVMIGLAEEPARYERDGYTPITMARGYRRFRARGMPFATAPRERVVATARACRAVVATRLDRPDLEWAAFRALQFAWFTTELLLDTDEAVATALGRVQGLDARAITARLDDPDVDAAYEADRAVARTAKAGPAHFQGKAAATDGPWRYTAPSLIFETRDGRRLEAGGFQPLEAYDVCVANLDATLERRGPAEDVAELLEAFPGGLTTREVAQCLTPENEQPDDARAEDVLIEATAAGGAVRESLGDDALWLAPARAQLRVAA
ncbi:MAG TPA: hypothetical protein VGV40_01710 [Solirubrobacteraceae bacterium]|nr:hypothetical protein [Solirubrobacteraceae bacterium]